MIILHNNYFRSAVNEVSILSFLSFSILKQIKF